VNRRVKRSYQSLASMFDSPLDILRHASRTVVEAKNRFEVREGAEMAHLALASSLEVALKRRIGRYGEELEALKEVVNRCNDSSLAPAYKRLRRVLHGDCFHQDLCGSDASLEQALGEAKRVVEQILHAPRHKRGSR
jgi:hypothetical protein